MALIQCPECNKDVSAKAPACIHCGYPLDEPIKMPAAGFASAPITLPKKKSVIHKIISGIGLFLLVVALIKGIVSHISVAPETPSADNSQMVADNHATTAEQAAASLDKDNTAQTAGQNAVQQPTRPEKPSHNYVLEQDGEYGYQRPITNNEAEEGIASNPLTIIRYKGIKNGLYTVEQYKGAKYTVLTCKAPCDFIKIVSYPGDAPPNIITIPAGQTVAHDIMSDAMNGFLKVYPESSGPYGTPALGSSANGQNEDASPPNQKVIWHSIPLPYDPTTNDNSAGQNS